MADIPMGCGSTAGGACHRSPCIPHLERWYNTVSTPAPRPGRVGSAPSREPLHAPAPLQTDRRVQRPPRLRQPVAGGAGCRRPERQRHLRLDCGLDQPGARPTTARTSDAAHRRRAPGPTTACASSAPMANCLFAGHPTLGSCRLAARPAAPCGWARSLAGQVVQECGVGLVTLRQDGERLAFAAPPSSEAARWPERRRGADPAPWAWRAATSCTTPGATTAPTGAA